VNTAARIRVATAWRDAGQILNTNRLVLVVTLVMIFLAAARTPVDSDMWWHLRAGESTWTEGRAQLVDAYSFTRLGHPWVNHSWLSQVGLYLLFQWGSYLALGAAVALLAAGMMALVYFQQEGPALLRAFLLVLAAAVSAVVWSPRPQTVSLFLFALTMYLLHLYKRKQRDLLWLLLPLFVLWSNLHGGYALGLIAIAAVVAGEVLNHLLGHPGPEVLSWRQVRKLVLAGILSALVVVINPNGVQAWLIPFQTVNVGVLQNYISEWASPDFHNLVQQPLLWLTFALLGAVGLSGRRLDGSDLTAVVIFGMMAFIARRNYGPFALVATPVLSRHLWVVIQDVLKLEEEGSEPLPGDLQEGQTRLPGWKRTINLLLVAVLGFAAIGKLYFVTHPVFVESHLQSVYPVGAVHWMQAQRLPGNLLNEYGWGGYLVWNLRENPVFVDGRTDLFGDEVIGEWMQVVQGGDGWIEVVERREVDLILLEPHRPVTGLLVDHGWNELYRDDVSVLYGR
jgi:hypothetical protein